MKELRPKWVMLQAQTLSGLKALFCQQSIQLSLVHTKTNDSDWGYAVILLNTIYHIQLTYKRPRYKNLNSGIYLFIVEVSQPQPYWHFEPNNSLLWGRLLYTIHHLAASLASTHEMPVAHVQLWQPEKISPDIANHWSNVGKKNHWSKHLKKIKHIFHFIFFSL